MGQVTLYLDEETEAAVRAAAEAAKTSMSRWVADAIRSRCGDRWPPSVARLAGAWTDLPEANELRAAQAPDLPREPL